MITEVYLPEETAEQALFAYAIMKGYIPKVQSENEIEITEEIDNPVSPLEFISQVKQKEMVEDMLVLTVKQVEAQARQQIEATKQGLSQAVTVTING